MKIVTLFSSSFSVFSASCSSSSIRCPAFRGQERGGGRRRGRERRFYHTLRGSGFTLMEIMVVLVLLAIMAAVIIPEMKGSFEDALLRSNARKLADVFNLAYSRAVSLNQLHRVRF